LGFERSSDEKKSDKDASKMQMEAAKAFGDVKQRFAAANAVTAVTVAVSEAKEAIVTVGRMAQVVTFVKRHKVAVGVATGSLAALTAYGLYAWYNSKHEAVEVKNEAYVSGKFIETSRFMIGLFGPAVFMHSGFESAVKMLRKVDAAILVGACVLGAYEKILGGVSKKRFDSFIAEALDFVNPTTYGEVRMDNPCDSTCDATPKQCNAAFRQYQSLAEEEKDWEMNPTLMLRAAHSELFARMSNVEMKQFGEYWRGLKAAHPLSELVFRHFGETAGWVFCSNWVRNGALAAIIGLYIWQYYRFLQIKDKKYRKMLKEAVPAFKSLLDEEEAEEAALKHEAAGAAAPVKSTPVVMAGAVAMMVPQRSAEALVAQELENEGAGTMKKHYQRGQRDRNMHKDLRADYSSQDDDDLEMEYDRKDRRERNWNSNEQDDDVGPWCMYCSDWMSLGEKPSDHYKSFHANDTDHYGGDAKERETAHPAETATAKPAEPAKAEPAGSPAGRPRSRSAGPRRRKPEAAFQPPKDELKLSRGELADWFRRPVEERKTRANFAWKRLKGGSVCDKHRGYLRQDPYPRGIRLAIAMCSDCKKIPVKETLTDGTVIRDSTRDHIRMMFIEKKGGQGDQKYIDSRLLLPVALGGAIGNSFFTPSHVLDDNHVVTCFIRKEVDTPVSIEQCKNGIWIKNDAVIEFRASESKAGADVRKKNDLIWWKRPECVKSAKKAPIVPGGKAYIHRLTTGCMQTGKFQSAEGQIASDSAHDCPTEEGDSGGFVFSKSHGVYGMHLAGGARGVQNPNAFVSVEVMEMLVRTNL
jgi:hypothetical protein